nr:uncharacterized protein LOC103433287 [Malus domestica]
MAVNVLFYELAISLWEDPYIGFPIGSRIKLRDGRHLAYKEHGVPKDNAQHKIVYVHGIDNCRHDAVVAEAMSPETVKDLGIYVVTFDRPGYGESDPNPKRTVKSMATDIEELADQLGLGHRFYVIGFSMGGQAQILKPALFIDCCIAMRLLLGD